MVAAFPEGIAAGEYATAAEDKPALAVTQTTAQVWGGNDLAEVPRHCDGLIVGTAAGVPSPGAVSKCRLPQPQQFSDEDQRRSPRDPSRPSDAGMDHYRLPRCAARRRIAIRRQTCAGASGECRALYRRNELSTRQLLAINEIAGVLDTAALVAMRRRVAAGADPGVVADAWLAEHPLGR